MIIKPYEFWNPRLFEIPYYLYLGLQCIFNMVGIKSLAKANYNLDHGEIGIGSKYHSQMAFNQDYFLPTSLLKHSLDATQKQQFIAQFAEQYGYPVILKSDVGCVGKGISKISSAEDIADVVPLLLGDYIVQQFTHNAYECGIFYVRHNGVAKITGMNKKHFPTVVGNGQDTLLQLAKKHPRYNEHWQSFLQYLDTDTVPANSESVRLSFIGSHTLGCKFTSDSHLLTKPLENAIFKVFDSQPGFNFGRVDVKAESEEALLAGHFVVIEVNGVASLPTHMFDPKFSVIEAYKIFFEHARYLAKIAREHKHKHMNLLSYRQIIQRVKTNHSLLNQVHDQLKG